MTCPPLPRRRWLCTAALALALLAGTAPAARAVSFQVSPTRFEFSLSERFTNFFTLTNNSGEPLRIRVMTSFLDAGPDGNLVERKGSPFDLSPWLVINPRRVTLDASERRVVRFTVRPPRNLKPGEYRAVVFFEELPSRPGERSQGEEGFRIQLLTRLGVTIYGRVGDTAPVLNLEQPTLEAAKDAVVFNARVFNAGTRHATITVAGTLRVPDGDTVGDAEQRVTIQRDQRRPVTLRLERPPPGRYLLHVEGRVEDERFFTSELPVQVERPAP